MFLVQIFLPLYDNAGRPLDVRLFDEVRQNLTERFGGMTAHTRAPAEGLWKDDAKSTRSDDVVIFEVIVDELDEAWWRGYRTQLEAIFRQEQILIRAQEMRLL